MATPTYGALVMSSSSTASNQQPQVDSFGDLKKCVAKVVRGEGQSKYLEYAADGILAGIDDINMRHLFQFASKRSTGTGAAFTDGTRLVPLASDFFSVREVQVLDSNAKPYLTMQYLPFEQLNELEQTQTKTGIPKYWTVRNSYLDATSVGGQLLFYPTPDATAEASYKYLIEYYERVERPSDDSDIISGPRELSDVLCAYGQYHLLFILDGRDSTRWGHKLALYRNKLDAFRQSVSRAEGRTGAWAINYDRSPNDSAFDPLSD